MTITRGLLCMLALTLLSAASAAQTRSIEGVWKATEVTGGPAGTTKTVTQPSMYLFTKKHYSIIYVSSENARPVPDDITKLTADDLRSIFVDSFVANAGTYEMKAGKLTTHPQVAKSPGYMKPDVWQTSSVSIKGNTMTLVTESSNQGPSKNPTTTKLVRVE